MLRASPSSRGLGHRVFIPATRVRIPLEMPFFLSFFPRIVSNPCKKQSSVRKFIFRQRIFLFAVIFCNAKNGITHLPAGCRRFILHSTSCEGGCAPARRAAPAVESQIEDRPVLIYQIIDQAAITERRYTPRRHVAVAKNGITHLPAVCDARAHSLCSC